jgi:hypothetical protein
LKLVHFASQNSSKRWRSDTEAKSVVDHEVPKVDASLPSFSLPFLLDVYNKFQVVHLINVARKRVDASNTLSWEGMGQLFGKLSESDQKTWCIETTSEGLVPSPIDFFKPIVTSGCGYVSFLVQSDESYPSVLKSLPFIDFDFSNNHISPSQRLQYEAALWFFFGRNRSADQALRGRAEHIDSVTHDGTWHYQLSGFKQWTIRPSPSLVEHFQKHHSHTWQHSLSEDSPLTMTCQQGDVLVINTRLWFHQTTIPPQQYPSVSYARDFRIQDIDHSDTNSDIDSDVSLRMKNVDGLYATTNIAANTILFTEYDLPECELPRSNEHANCHLVTLDDGTQAVVTTLISHKVNSFVQ